MDGYGIGLFVHVTGALTLFMGIAIAEVAAGGMRAATDVPRLRLWLAVAGRAGVAFPVAAVLLVGSGLYLTTTSWSFSTPWVATSIGGVVVIALAGGRVAQLGEGGVRTALGDARTGPLPPAVTEQLARRAPAVASFAIDGLALGIVFLMTAKPGWAVAGTALVVGAAAGALVGNLLVGGTARRSSAAGAAAG